MSEKPQTFDEWWTEQVMTGEDSIICRELTKLGVAELAYNAGQQSMATAPGALTEIVNAMNNTEFFKSTPNMAPQNCGMRLTKQKNC